LEISAQNQTVQFPVWETKPKPKPFQTVSNSVCTSIEKVWFQVLNCSKPSLNCSKLGLNCSKLSLNCFKPSLSILNEFKLFQTRFELLQTKFKLFQTKFKPNQTAPNHLYWFSVQFQIFGSETEQFGFQFGKIWPKLNQTELSQH